MIPPTTPFFRERAIMPCECSVLYTDEYKAKFPTLEAQRARLGVHSNPSTKILSTMELFESHAKGIASNSRGKMHYLLLSLYKPPPNKRSSVCKTSISAQSSLLFGSGNLTIYISRHSYSFCTKVVATITSGSRFLVDSRCQHVCSTSSTRWPPDAHI